MTSRAMSSASSAVIMEPLPRAPSTTTTALASPATIRLRAGKRNGSGGVPGGYSLTTVASSASRSRSRRFDLGYTTSIPDPRTATVGPPARSAPSCAAASIPMAAPLMTHEPAAASAEPRSWAISRPAGLHVRLPTIATGRIAGCASSGWASVEDVAPSPGAVIRTR
jgi:hypothetical protein